MLDQFIALIRQYIDQAIYVWGGQGQPTNEADIRRCETSSTNAERAIALYNRRVAQGVNPVIKFDCSGLIIWALQQLGLIGYDTTANGLYRKAQAISRDDLLVGDLVFKTDSSGTAYHVGVVTRIVNGLPYITEAKGRDYGVIETAVSTNWDKYGRNPFIDTTGGTTMSTILKLGSQGDAVKEMQQKLIFLEYDLGTAGADGDFGSKTDAAVRAFQTDAKITVDGQAGPQTLAALDAAVIAKKAQTSIIDYKPALDAANKQIDDLEAKVLFLSNEIAAGQSFVADLKSQLEAEKPLADKYRTIKSALA